MAYVKLTTESELPGDGAPDKGFKAQLTYDPGRIEKERQAGRRHPADLP